MRMHTYIYIGSHRLCALICARGGAHVTTNFSGVQLLAQPHEPEKNSISFVAVHGTLFDQQQGREGAGGWRRPRCRAQADMPLLKGRGLTVPIPVGPVKDKDPNMVEARAAAKGRTVMLILGNSLAKPTNGRALHFLDAAKSISRVIFVNIDSSRNGSQIEEELEGWGLPVRAQVVCVAMGAEEFADAVLKSAADAAQPAQLRDDVERSRAWVQQEKVDEMRHLFPLPPKRELSIANHAFGAAQVTVGEIYDLIARGHSQKHCDKAAAAASPLTEDEDDDDDTPILDLPRIAAASVKRPRLLATP